MNYHHLTIEERSCIRKYYVDGLSYREIARLIGRNVSTVSREIRRNCSHMSIMGKEKLPLLYWKCGLRTAQAKGGHSKMNDVNSLAHSSWNCKYHVVFAPKYRRKVFFGEKRREIGSILRTLCNWKGIKIIEAEVCADHIHMLIEIPPKIAVASFMGYLKGKSSLMLYEKFPEQK